MARGRPRKQGIPRDPDGKPSRRYTAEMTEREARSVMIAARVRMYGVTEHQAGLNEIGMPNAGNLYGRMRLQGTLSADQWSAAEWYVNKRNAWLRAIQAKGEASGGDGQGTNRGDTDSYVDWVRETIDTWKQVIDCVQDISIETRSPVKAALDMFLKPDGGVYLPHLEGTFKVGLNAIYRRFLQGRR